MGWLAGWKHRVVVTASHAQVDADLTQFPLLLKLGTAVGTSAADVSAIFDELASDANRLKIAVTKADGTTELYVEIEKWDDANETAFLRVSKSDFVLAGASDTTLYFYYDSSHADNTTYVADAGSRTEIWDSGHEGVYHLAETGANPTLVDSTDNNNDSTTNLSDPTTSGKIDGAALYTVANKDYSIVGAAVGDGMRTVEVWFKPTANFSTTETVSQFLLARRAAGSDVGAFGVYLEEGDGKLYFFIRDSAVAFKSTASDATSWTAGTWYHVVGTIHGTTGMVLYINGVAQAATNASTQAAASNDDETYFGRYGNNDLRYFGGTLDEVRISSVVRSAAWVKACYYSAIDGVVAWGTFDHTKAIAGTAATAATTRRKTEKAVSSATVATVGAVVRAAIWAKVVAAAIVETVGTVARKAGKRLSAAVDTAGTVSRLNSLSKAISGTVGTIGSVARATAKHIADTTVDTVATVARGMVCHKLVDAATVATLATVDRVMTFAKALSTTVTAIGLSIRPITVWKHVTGTAGTVATIRPVNIWRAITATVGTISSVARKTSKHVLLATVDTIGTIWATAGQVVAGGVATAASVARKTFRHLTAVVSTVSTLSSFLYDIVYAMNQTIRHIYGRVRITYTDPYFSAGVATAADSVGDYTYTDQTVDNVTEEEYKWFSLHRNVLDGTYHPLPGDRSSSVGWWGTQLSDFVTRVFVPTYPKLTITHAARAVERLLVVGDDQLNEYPVDFTIKLYDSTDVLQYTETVTGNAAVIFSRTLSPAQTGIAKQELEITKWSRGDSVCKIAQFFTTLEETYESEDGELVTINVTEQREFTGTTIPQGNLANAEISVRLNNIDGTFDSGNTASRLYGLLLNNRAITAWLGVDLYPSGVRRWYPLGTFYSRDWSAPDSEIWAEVTGQDMLARLQSTTFSTSEVYETKTLEELAIIVMTDAGLTSADWEIDAALSAITVPYAWFDAVSHRECLRKIAAACMGQCYCNRDGKIVLEVYSAPSLNPFEYTAGNVFNIDHPLAWSQMVNYVEAQAAPRVASPEVDIVTDLETFTVPALSSVTKMHFYILSPCVDVQPPVITADPDITVSGSTAYAWGISITYANAGVGDETVTLVTVAGKPLEVVGSRVVVAQDAASIAQNGKQTLPETITSEFWQDETRAQAVADAILQTYRNPRRDIVMRARGNIAQLLGDRVKCPDSLMAGTTMHFGIVGQDIGYDGGLEIVVTAQRLGTQTAKTLTATVGTVATRSWKPVEKKGLAIAQVGAVGTVIRAALHHKAVSAVVSTVSSIHLSPIPPLPIDIGPGATDRALQGTEGHTWISETNPANHGGLITSVDLWFAVSATGVKVATFSKSGSVFTPRAVAAIGAVTAGAKRTFVVSLAVASGDYIGFYGVLGNIELDSSGGSTWLLAGADGTTGPNTYNHYGYEISIYATGETD